MNVKRITCVLSGLIAAAMAAFVGWFAFNFIAWLVAIMVAALATLAASAAAYHYGCGFVASKLGVDKPVLEMPAFVASMKARFASATSTTATAAQE